MLSVVMPAHNEEGYLEPSIKAVVTGLHARAHDFEVIVVENGSLDSTLEEAAQLAETFPEVRVLSLPEANYGFALRRGFLEAKGEIIVNFDVDFVDLEFLDQAIARMGGNDVAVVVGTKRGPGSEDQRAAGRKLVTAVFSSILKFGFGLSVSDTHGIKALRREPLEAIVEACKHGADIFDTELILRAQKQGLALAEIPVVVSDVRPPRTPIIRRIPRTLMGLTRLRFDIGKGN